MSDIMDYTTIIVISILIMIAGCIWYIWAAVKHAQRRKDMTPEEKMADSLNTMAQLEQMRMWNESCEKLGNSFKQK